MKKALLAVVALALLAACSDDKPKWQSNASVYITGVESELLTTGKGRDALLTVREVVEETSYIQGWNFDNDKLAEYPEHFLEVAVNGDQRDLVNGRLMMYSHQVIDPLNNGILKGGLLDITDVTLREIENQQDPDYIKDAELTYADRIIAYIPNAVIKKAAVEIRAAYAAGNYDEVYRLFNEAYTFIPITHNKWIKLKETGRN